MNAKPIEAAAIAGDLARSSSTVEGALRQHVQEFHP